MIAVACVLLYLGIARDYEPLLLVPIGAGCLLANLPLSPLIADDGMLRVLYNAGITNELFPLLIFIGIGALTDFGPLLENPRMVLLGAAGQFGIFMTLVLALVLGFSREEAASIGIIGAIDGPTSIYVSGILAPHLLGPITVAAYSYMSLVPIILPPIMRALTSERERRIRMPYTQRAISRRTRILFPIVVTVLVGTLVPFATPLIGMLMLGNLMKESGAVQRLTKASSEEIANIVTLFLGLAIGSTMVGAEFLKPSTLAILVLGILAFTVDAAAGLLFGKVLNLFSGGRFNPLIGAAGISAFPMAARVVHKVAQDEDYENFLLMHAMGANAAGQVASVVAGGVLLALMGAR
ncbi:MAG TPA: sodium ion-translocating decarboxylase subunit beta [Burkholderiales bacterium]|nr:sodium ion-translocating decarboxylase subunit beta [Burkholderiales bacterium]